MVTLAVEGGLTVAEVVVTRLTSVLVDVDLSKVMGSEVMTSWVVVMVIIELPVVEFGLPRVEFQLRTASCGLNVEVYTDSEAPVLTRTLVEPLINVLCRDV